MILDFDDPFNPVLEGGGSFDPFTATNRGNVKQSTLKYACSAGIAKTDLYTGELKFEHQNISIGGGNYKNKFVTYILQPNR